MRVGPQYASMLMMLSLEVHGAQACFTKPYGAHVQGIKCVCCGHMVRQTSGDDLFFTLESQSSDG